MSKPLSIRPRLIILFREPTWVYELLDSNGALIKTFLHLEDAELYL
jgi:hypothetical protein